MKAQGHWTSLNSLSFWSTNRILQSRELWVSQAERSKKKKSQPRTNIIPYKTGVWLVISIYGCIEHICLIAPPVRKQFFLPCMYIKKCFYFRCILNRFLLTKLWKGNFSELNWRNKDKSKINGCNCSCCTFSSNNPVRENHSAKLQATLHRNWLVF